MSCISTLRFGLFAVVLCAAACSSIEPTRQIPVDGTFLVRDTTWTKTVNGAPRAPGQHRVVLKVIDVDGMLEVCGAWADGGFAARDAAHRSMHDHVVSVKGVRVMEDLSFFTQARSIEDLPNAQATCAATGKPAPDRPWDVRFRSFRLGYTDTL